MNNLQEDALRQLERYLAINPGEQFALASLSEQLLHDPDGIFHRATMQGHITTSALVLDPVACKVLVIHHKVYDSWMPPGGHYELPGDMMTSALRECREETGLSRVDPIIWAEWLGLVFDIDTHAIAANPAKNEGAHFHHDFTFLFRADSAAPLVPQQDEVFGARWISLRDFAQLPEARLRRLHRKLVSYLVGSLASRLGDGASAFSPGTLGEVKLENLMTAATARAMSVAAEAAFALEDDGEKAPPTTVRLSKRTLVFFEVLADALRISRSSSIEMTLDQLVLSSRAP